MNQIWKKVHIFIYWLYLISCWLKGKTSRMWGEEESSRLGGGSFTCGPEFRFLFVRYGCWPCSSLSFQDSTPRTTEKVPLKGGKSSDLGWIIQMPSQDAVPAYLQEMPSLSAIGVGRMEVGAGWADASDLSGQFPITVPSHTTSHLPNKTHHWCSQAVDSGRDTRQPCI